VEIRAGDLALNKPSKPVGTHFDHERAQSLMRDLKWEMVETAHGWRRVVPSPTPIAIMEIDLIRRLLEDGDVIVAVGGGGIPVARDEKGNLNGYEAVVDKDLASGILARDIGAETLMILTSVQHVSLDFNKPTQRKVERMTVLAAKQHLADGQFPAGSMGPKIRAAVNFLESSDREHAQVLICDIDHFEAAMAGHGGTRVVRG
jgi:carbamate kinase